MRGRRGGDGRAVAPQRGACQKLAASRFQNLGPRFAFHVSENRMIDRRVWVVLIHRSFSLRAKRLRPARRVRDEKTFALKEINAKRLSQAVATPPVCSPHGVSAAAVGGAHLSTPVWEWARRFFFIFRLARHACIERELLILKVFSVIEEAPMLRSLSTLGKAKKAQVDARTYRFSHAPPQGHLARKVPSLCVRRKPCLW